MMFRPLAAALAVSALTLAAGPASARQVVCESFGRERTLCRADPEGGVRLVRQMGTTRCVERDNWNWDRDGIWVSNGCRAVFETVGVSDDRGDSREHERGHRDGLRGRYDNNRPTPSYDRGYREGERDRNNNNNNNNDRPATGSRAAELQARAACSARLSPPDADPGVLLPGGVRASRDGGFSFNLHTPDKGMVNCVVDRRGRVVSTGGR